jgi:hypothetical protein
MLIINEYNDESYNKIKFIQKILIDDNKKDHKKKYLFVIHNNYKIINDQEYNYYVNNIFRNNQNFNENNYYYTEKLEDDKLKDSIIIYHFIINYDPEKIEQPILEKLKEQINNIKPIELNKPEKFNEMIKKNFNVFIGNLFNIKDYSIDFNNNYLQVNIKNKNSKEIENIIKNDFEENTFFNSFQLLIPDYSFYFKNKNTFVLQLEVNAINRSSIKCRYERIPNDTRTEFLIKIEKNDLNSKYHRGIYKNFRKKGLYEINIIVPLAGYSINKLEKTTYKSGVLNLIYNVTNTDNDDDDIVELEDEEEEDEVENEEDEDENEVENEEDEDDEKKKDDN